MIEWKPKSIQPKDNVLIQVKGSDWSEFTAIGMFIPYKGKNPVKNGVSQRRRFCSDNGSGYFNCHDTWLDTLLWRELTPQTGTEEKK